MVSVVADFIASGILEKYVMGCATDEETAEVEKMAARFEEVAFEIKAINSSLEDYASEYAIMPDPTIEPLLMATVDYMERIKNGEPLSFPPLLTGNSKASDYYKWLNRKDLQIKELTENIHARIIGYTPELMTAIVWIRDGAPEETHTKEIEKVLIVEGACEVTIENYTLQMGAGDIISIPLHKKHFVKVTSAIPCKVILQRVAA